MSFIINTTYDHDGVTNTGSTFPLQNSNGIPITLSSTTTISLGGNGTISHPVYGNVNVSSVAGNSLIIESDGLYANVSGGIPITSVTATTLVNNVLDVVKSSGSAALSTINATTGGTYSNGTITLLGSGSLTSISGLPTGFTSTIITGGSYNNGTLSLTNSSGGTLTVSGFYTGITSILTTGGTYNNGSATFTNNTGGTFTVSGFDTNTNTFTTASTYNSSTGIITFTRNDNSQYTAGTWNYLTALTLTNNIATIGSNGLAAVLSTINAATGGTYANGTISLLGSGSLTNISGLISANTITTGGTYSNGTLSITNNSGTTFNVTGLIASAVTSTTLTNNILTEIQAQGSPVNTTINAATGGTYANGTISLLGSGSLTNITGLIASAVTSTTLTNNILTAIQAAGSAVNTTINAATGGTYSNGIITLLGSGSFSTITGLLSADTYTTGGTFSYNTQTLTLRQNNGVSNILIAGFSDVFVTGGTYSNGAITFTNNSGATFNVTGLIASAVTSTTLTNNILTETQAQGSAVNTTINAATGGTYSNGIITLLGSGSFSTITGLPVSSNSITGLTVNNNIVSGTLTNSTTTATTINAATGGSYFQGVITLLGSGSFTTISNVLYDTGITNSNNVITITNNTGGTLTTVFNTVTGLTVNGTLSSLTLSATNITGITISATTLNIGGTANAGTFSGTNITGLTISATNITTGGAAGTFSGSLSGSNITGITISAASITSGTLIIGSGTANIPSERTVTGGTLTTIPVVGAFELDSGSTPYYTFALGSRGVIKTEQILTSTGTTTLSSTTVSQPLFSASTTNVLNGTVNIQEGYSYSFECSFDLSGMSTTSGSFGFGLSGSSGLSRVRYTAMVTKDIGSATSGLPFVTGTSPSTMATIRTRATTIISSANTGTTGTAFISGTLRCNGSGTLRPDITLSQAAAAVVAQDSYFKINPIGTDGQFTLGSWT